MAFLAPLFLAGLAALALPVLMHLRKNRPQQTVAFSSLMFLDASPPVTKRRSRLQDVVLLVLRCLALALLAIAFARPFLPDATRPVAAEGTVMNLILIDNSASMRGAAMEQAMVTAGSLVDGFSQDDWIAVATFADRFQPLLGPDRARELPSAERKSAARAVLSTVEAGWSATRPDAALLAAVAMVDEDAPLKIHVIGDFQKGATFERLRGESWPKSLQVIAHPVAFTKGWTNAGLSLLPPKKHSPRVRVTNSEGSAKSDFSLSWNGKPLTVSVPPGESAVFNAPPGFPAEGRVTLGGDDFAFDNEVAWTTPARPVARIWYPGPAQAADATDNLYFLGRALQSNDDYEIEISSGLPKEAPALSLTDGRLDEAAVPAFRRFLQDGGHGLFIVRDVESAAGIATILGVQAGPAREARIADHARFGEIDFNSSVFSPFADARYSDFSGIRFWHHRILAPDLTARGKVLARFDSGEPAWLDFPLGKGTLHVLTSTWRPVDSQLALTTKFPPLLHSLLAVPTTRRGPLWVGEPFTLPTGSHEITLPGGEKTNVSPGEAFSTTDTPGIYRGNGFVFSVQLDPSETELTPLPESELRALRLPLESRAFTPADARIQISLSNLEQERRQRLGWWALVAAAGFFLAETAWAGYTSNRRTPDPA